MTTSLLPGDAPVGLNEARAWLRMGASIDDAVIAALVRAAASICEAFIGGWLIIRAVHQETVTKGGAIRLNARPLVAVDAVRLDRGDGAEPLAADRWRLEIAPDGTGWLTLLDPGAAGRIEVDYHAGMAADVNAVPEAIRQGLLRMVQHLHEARDSDGGPPPAAIAALWQPWRRVTLGGGR